MKQSLAPWKHLATHSSLVCINFLGLSKVARQSPVLKKPEDLFYKVERNNDPVLNSLLSVSTFNCLPYDKTFGHCLGKRCSLLKVSNSLSAINRSRYRSRDSSTMAAKPVAKNFFPQVGHIKRQLYLHWTKMLSFIVQILFYPGIFNWVPCGCAF
jgi:hypothetical protein